MKVNMDKIRQSESIKKKNYIYIYKLDLALNNLQWLYAIKPTKPNHVNFIYMYERIWHWMTNNGWYVMTPNLNQPNQIIYI